jgi:hypothetical protein
MCEFGGRDETYDCHHGYSAMAARNGGLETPPYMTIDVVRKCFVR